MKKIFLIGGLGADERIFQNLDLPYFEKIFIKWVTPNKKESIKNYSKRITSQITEQNAIILGVSFGGMLATEIAKFYPESKVFIVSSAKTFKEIPLIYRIIGRLGCLKIIPANVLKYHSSFTDWFFGVENKEESTLLSSILAVTDSYFLKWALQQITLWNNKVVSSNLIHIHGDKDRILPLNFTKPDYIIQGGGHFMIFNRAKEIEEILLQ
ncbi:MAG: alpha/beta hydrolase [Spirosomataceae bacterium]